MEYTVYKKISELYQYLLKVTSADIKDDRGRIKKSYWSADDLAGIEREIEEKLPELQALEDSFLIEVKSNTDAGGEEGKEYIGKADRKLNDYRDSFQQLQEIWEKGEMDCNGKFSFIQSIEKLVTSVEVFMDILVACEPVFPEELLSPKIIYMEFSGIVDAIRNSLKENLKKERLTNVRLAETLALITEENQVEIEQLLPKLSYLKAGNPHAIFTAKMISEAITHLEKDGFDTTGLKAVVGKMQTDSKYENDNASS